MEICVSINLPLPTDKQIHNLDIEQLAKDDAANGIPHYEDTDLTASEQLIETFIYNHINETGTNIDNTLQTDHEIRQKINIDKATEQLKHADSTLHVDIDKLEKSNLPDLVRAKLNENETQITFNLFKSENKLFKTAIYPKDRQRSYLFVSIIMILESILNATFLSQGSELGLVGGITFALLITLGNCLLAWMIVEFSIRYISHVKIQTKIVAWLLMCILSIIILHYIFLVGHFRDAISDIAELGISVKEASVNAVTAMYENPYMVTDFYSWILIVVSFLAAAIMGYKFYFADDPYPSYGRLHRKLIEVERQYQNMENNHRDELITLTRKASSDLILSKSECNAGYQEYRMSLVHSESLTEDYNHYIPKMEKLCEKLLFQYRKINKQIRTQALPDYFNEEIKLDSTEIQTLNTSLIDLDNENIKTIEQVIEIVPQLFEETNAKLISIQSEFDKRTRLYSEKITIDATNMFAKNATN